MLLACFLAVSGASGAIELTYTSGGTERVALVELFTSQGCNSCPPADRWLTSLKDNPGLWSEFVPLAWHVDYWDGLGWTDRYASAAHSVTQRRYVARGALSSLYTPAFLVGGSEWKAWAHGFPKLAPLSEKTGTLTLRVDPISAELEFVPIDRDRFGDIEAHIALLGMDRHTPVAAGENNGHTLIEDFIVLAHHRFALRHNSSGHLGSIDLPEGFRDRQAPLALVAWVTTVGDFQPIQATGGWYPLRSMGSRPSR